MGLTPSPSVAEGTDWTAIDSELYCRHGSEVHNAYWCGRCGAGPYETFPGLARHNGQRHAGPPITHSRPLAPDETPEEPTNSAVANRAAVERALWDLAQDLGMGEAELFYARDLAERAGCGSSAVGKHLTALLDDGPVTWGGAGFHVFQSPDNSLHHSATKWGVTPWTPGEEATSPEASLPDDVTEPQLRTIVSYAETIDEVMADLAVDVDRARAILEARDLADQVHPWPKQVQS